MRSWVKYGVFLLIIFAMVLWLGGFLAKKEKAGEIKRESPHVQGLTIGQVEKAIEVVSYYAGQVVAD
ncbi:MAG: efflux transporter periplasmic adaptor subunit, partial [Aquificaceae bacterium]|nr:efflux transporter periplasmic adaptor subunit [Aquificaceae bacterium]